MVYALPTVRLDITWRKSYNHKFANIFEIKCMIILGCDQKKIPRGESHTVTIDAVVSLARYNIDKFKKIELSVL